ncbi:unnamed protein product, partial [Rotaria magnacalcarata]
MNIDTSKCGFNTTPLYFTSTGGTSSHWSTVGYRGVQLMLIF